MADSVVQGLSADPSRIPSKWNRQTVADGSWLQKYTLNPLSARDVYLAEQIDNGTSALSAAISAEVERATSAEYELQYQIDLMNAATDVINVFGTYGGENGFAEKSGCYFDPQYSATYHLTNNDIIKIINDEHTPVGETGNLTTGHQTYYQWVNYPSVTGDPTTTADGEWHFIGFTEPYYNTAEIDEYFETLSGSISSNYYASGNISAVGNLTANYSTNKPPKIEIGIKDDVTFKSVTTNSATTTSLSSQSVTAVNLSSNNISATNISATTLSASTAYVQSAKFNDISATHLTANNISSTNLTALTASGNQASYTNISGTTLSGPTASINIDDLINAATAGAVAYSGENGIYVSSHKIGLLSGYENAVKEGSAASAYISSHSGDFLNSAHSAYNKLTFKFGGTTKDYQANNSAYAFTFSAGEGINFITGNNQITITSNDTTYQGSTYISTVNNTITVKDDLIGSAQSGKAAWNILSGTKISAVGTSLPNTGFGNLSAGFRISAGNNLTISTDANNTIQLNAKDTGITSISAKTGNSTALFSDHNVNLSAGTGVGFNFGNNLLTISAEGKTYSDGNYIKISGNNNSINVSGTLINSAQSGQSAYDWITTKSATLQAGPGIGFYSAGQNILGISAEGISYTTGRGIDINGTVISVKDEFVPWSAVNAPIGTNNGATNTAFAQGTNNNASNTAFAQGYSNTAYGNSFSQGTNNGASFTSFAQGELNSANYASFAQGYNNTAKNYSFVQGSANNIASEYSFAQGTNNSSYYYSLTQGKSNTAKNYSFSQGNENLATGYSFAQGSNNSSYYYSLAQGYENFASGLSFANGMSNIAGNNSFAQGNENSADKFSFALGMNNTVSSFAFAHGESNNVKDFAFAQGASNTANKYSVAIGQWCSAYEYGQAFGDSTVISGGMAIGNCNASTAGVAFVIGDGIDNNNRHDLFSINHNGDMTINWSASDPNVSQDPITGETIIGGYYVNTKYNTVGGTGQDTTAQATWIDMMSNQVRFAYSADLAHSAEKVLGGPAGDSLQPVYLTTSGTIQSCSTINRALDIEVISTASGTEGNVGTLDTSMEQIAVDTIVLQPKQATEQGEHNNLNINRLIIGKVYKIFMVSSSLSWSLYLQRNNANGTPQQFVVIDNNGTHNNNHGWIAEGMRQSGYNTSSTIYLIRTDNNKILIMYGY